MASVSSDPCQRIARTMGADCLAMRVRFLSRSLTGIYDDAFRPLGATAAQVSILGAVVSHGSIAPVDLGSILNIEKSTLSRNLDRMRRNGWLKIIPAGRTQSVSATAKGRRLLEEAAPFWDAAQKAARMLLGAEGARELHHVADSLQARFSGP